VKKSIRAFFQQNSYIFLKMYENDENDEKFLGKHFLAKDQPNDAKESVVLLAGYKFYKQQAYII
jgi:hypothetical protein